MRVVTDLRGEYTGATTDGSIQNHVAPVIIEDQLFDAFEVIPANGARRNGRGHEGHPLRTLCASEFLEQQRRFAEIVHRQSGGPGRQFRYRRTTVGGDVYRLALL